MANVKISGDYLETCLIYEHIQETICSAYEAMIDKENELMDIEKKEIIESIDEYWHLR